PEFEDPREAVPPIARRHGFGNEAPGIRARPRERRHRAPAYGASSPGNRGPFRTTEALSISPHGGAALSRDRRGARRECIDRGRVFTPRRCQTTKGKP